MNETQSLVVKVPLTPHEVVLMLACGFHHQNPTSGELPGNETAGQMIKRALREKRERTFVTRKGWTRDADGVPYGYGIPSYDDFDFMSDFDFLADFETWPMPGDDGRELWLDHVANATTMPDEDPENWSEFRRTFDLPEIGVDVR